MPDTVDDQPTKPAILAALSDDDVQVKRRCVCCGSEYSIASHFGAEHYFDRPHDYVQGCVTHCLNCWLGNGPEEERELDNALYDLAGRLGPTTHLVLMPLIRVHSEGPVRLGNEIIVYPPGVDISGMNIRDPDKNSRKLSEMQSAASGVNFRTITQHPTIAFAAAFDWDAVVATSHASHMKLLAALSRHVDERCLNLVRYRICRLDRPETLPGRAGQLFSNPMMAGMVLYNAARQEGRVFGGSAFTHLVVKGLGLDIAGIAHEDFPQDGEVGRIVRRALGLYKAVLESDDESSKYIQALALLEFLANPTDYEKSKVVAKTIVRYIATTQGEYGKLIARFADLYHGVRTRIVHLGQNLEDVLPAPNEREALFQELAGYIGKVIDHMILHSALEWTAYLETRQTLGPFAMMR